MQEAMVMGIEMAISRLPRVEEAMGPSEDSWGMRSNAPRRRK